MTSAGKSPSSASAANGHVVLDPKDPSLMQVLHDFVSAVSFRPVAKMVSSAWTEHAPFVFWLVDAVRPRCSVELGVFHGFSYLAICQAVSATAMPSRCYGIDNWSGDE